MLTNKMAFISIYNNLFASRAVFRPQQATVCTLTQEGYPKIIIATVQISKTPMTSVAVASNGLAQYAGSVPHCSNNKGTTAPATMEKITIRKRAMDTVNAALMLICTETKTLKKATMLRMKATITEIRNSLEITLYFS